MRTITVLNQHTVRKMFYYARLAFLSGASTAFVCHSGVAQSSPDLASSSDAGNGKAFTYNIGNAQHATPANTVSYSSSDYRYISTLTTGPSSNYNITRFITKTIPVTSVQYTDKNATKMNNWALALADNADVLTTNAKEIRLEARQANSRWQAVALCKKADSMDALSGNKQFEATTTAIKANENQYEANNITINGYQHNSSYNTDVLTTAGLLSKEAAFYYSKALHQIQQSDTSIRMYVKQGFVNAAQKDMNAAVIKQQCAENIYISMNQNTSVALAEKIDSLLATPNNIIAKDDPAAFGKVVFCVQVGSYSNLVPIDKANKLLKISGLGITKHDEETGVTTYTIGEYTSFTCADMLSQELVEDGYTDSSIISYQKGGEQEPAAKWVIAKK